MDIAVEGIKYNACVLMLCCVDIHRSIKKQLKTYVYSEVFTWSNLVWRLVDCPVVLRFNFERLC